MPGYARGMAEFARGKAVSIGAGLALLLMLVPACLLAAEDGASPEPVGQETSPEGATEASDPGGDAGTDDTTLSEPAGRQEFGGRDDQPGILIRRTPGGEEYHIPDPCQPWKGGKLRPWDRTHHFISRTLCWPGKWFDGFFAAGEDNFDQSGTWVRVVGAYRWQDNHQEGDELEVDASAELPHAQRKLRLVFTSDDEGETLQDDQDNLPQDVGVAGDTGTDFRTALRVALRTTKKMNLDFDVGLRSELKTFFRARSRWRRQLTENWFGRLEEKVFWEDPDGWGSTTSLDFDRPLGEKLNLRFTTEAELTEENNELNRDWFLSQNATLFWNYSRRAAVSFNVGVDGFTDPVAKTQTWYTSIRLRRNFWRPWLFYELQPFAFWPRSDDFHGVTGITVRLETQFGLY